MNNLDVLTLSWPSKLFVESDTTASAVEARIEMFPDGGIFANVPSIGDCVALLSQEEVDALGELAAIKNRTPTNRCEQVLSSMLHILSSRDDSTGDGCVAIVRQSRVFSTPMTACHLPPQVFVVCPSTFSSTQKMMVLTMLQASLVTATSQPRLLMTDTFRPGSASPLKFTGWPNPSRIRDLCRPKTSSSAQQQAPPLQAPYLPNHSDDFNPGPPSCNEEAALEV